MLSVHCHVTVGRHEGVTTRHLTWFVEAHHLRAGVLGEIIAPSDISDMLLYHHSVPLASCYILVIATTKQRVTLEALLHAVSPSVCLRIAFCIEFMVHCLGVIHLIDIAKSLNGKEQQLTVSVVHVLRKGYILAQGVSLKTCKLVTHLLPLASLKIVSRSVEHLCRHTSCILAVEVE